MEKGSSGSPIITFDADMQPYLIGMLLLAETGGMNEMGSHNGAIGIAYKITILIERIKEATGIDLLVQ